MNSQRSSYRIAKRTFLNLVMFRKHLDPLSQPGSFYRYSQFLRQIIDIDPALSGKQWECQEYPEMAAPLAHFQRRFDAVLRELVLKLDQIIHRRRVVGID